MTASEVVASLRDRGISVSATSTSKLRVSPRSKLTPAERQYLAAHSQQVANALRTVDLVDSLIASVASVEQLLEQRTREMVERARHSRYAMFQTRRGLLHLEELSDREARHYAALGKLSESEVRTWWEWRHRRLNFPRETRYALWEMKARRAGFHHLVAYLDGQVVLS
jgi:hypothetical protein